MSTRQVYTILFCLLSIDSLVNFDGYVMSICLPTLSRTLGYGNYTIWVVSGYMLTNAAITPFIGKLSDIYGRKLMLYISLLIFMIGSLISGLSYSIIQLIIGRLIQGIGGSGLRSLPNICIGDLVPVKERAKYVSISGAFEFILGLCSPLIGGLLIQYISWRVIFLINPPFCVLAALIIYKYANLPLIKQDNITYKSYDIGGVILSVTSTASAIAGFTIPYNWNDWHVITLLSISVVCFVLFMINEYYVGDNALMPLTMFKQRNFTIGCLINITQGCTVMVYITYLPIFYQNVYNDSQSISGIRVAPGLFTLISTFMIVMRYISKQGSYHYTLLIGSIISLMGYISITTLFAIDRPYYIYCLLSLLYSVGNGITTPFRFLLIVNSVSQKYNASAITTQQYVNSMSAAIALACVQSDFATLFQSSIKSYWLQTTTLSLPNNAYSNIQYIKDTIGQHNFNLAYIDAFKGIWYFIIAASSCDVIFGILTKKQTLRQTLHQD